MGKTRSTSSSRKSLTSTPAPKSSQKKLENVNVNSIKSPVTAPTNAKTSNIVNTKKQPPPKKTGKDDPEFAKGRQIVASMSIDEIDTLLSNLLHVCPVLDSTRMQARTSKIKWEDIAFSDYDHDSCRLAWMYLQSNRRKHRNMWEVLTEVKESVKSRRDFRQELVKKAPGYPVRPPGSAGGLSMYSHIKYKEMLDADEKPEGFNYMTWYQSLVKEFATLSQQERDSWRQKSEQCYAEYKERLKEFEGSAPEFQNAVQDEKPSKQQRTKTVSAAKLQVMYPDAPKPPQTPAMAFFQAKLDGKSSPPSEEDIPELKQKYTKKFEKLSDSKKSKWISKVISETEDYYSAVEEYQQENPSYTSNFKITSVLTKAELTLWETSQGKPTKPPATPIQWFAQELEQSGALESCATELERKTLIDQKWNELESFDKDMRKIDMQRASVVYRQDITRYFGALPEFLRTVLITNLDKKTRSLITTSERTNVTVVDSTPKAPLKRKKKSHGKDDDENHQEHDHENDQEHTAATTSTVMMNSTPAKKSKKKKKLEPVEYKEEEEEMTGVSEVQRILDYEEKQREEERSKPSQSKKKSKKKGF